MGKKYVIDETTLTNMATSVREHLGVETKYRPEDMPTGIDSVYVVGVSDGEEVGFNDGFFVGQKEGYDEGHTEGYEAGKQESKNAFWRGFTDDGARKSYYYAFFRTDFSGETIPEGLCRPQYLNATFRAMDRMFHSYQGKELPKGIDTSLLADGENIGSQVFALSNLIEIADIGIPASSVMTSWYMDCYSLITIEKIRVNENTTYATAFRSCGKLENVTFEGVIGQNIDFSASPLTRESGLSVINHLKDISGTGTTLTLTLSSTTKALLTDEDKAIATQKGWTIA